MKRLAYRQRSGYKSSFHAIAYGESLLSKPCLWHTNILVILYFDMQVWIKRLYPIINYFLTVIFNVHFHDEWLAHNAVLRCPD